MATTSDLDPNFAPYVDWILAIARRYCGGATLTSTRRGFFHQARLYFSQSQSCPPGSSSHEVGYAADIVVAAGSASRDQAWLGAVWNAYCFNTWSPSDPVHFAAVRGCLSG